MKTIWLGLAIFALTAKYGMAQPVTTPTPAPAGMLSVPAARFFEGRALELPAVAGSGMTVRSLSFQNVTPAIHVAPGAVTKVVPKRAAANLTKLSLSRQRQALPVAFAVGAKTKAGADIAAVVQPWVEFQSTPLSWNPALGAYASGVNIYYTIEPATAVVPSSFSIDFAISVQNAQLQPSGSFRLAPGKVTSAITVFTKNYSGNVVVQISAEKERAEATATVQPLFDHLTLTATQTKVAAFSGTSTLQVSRFDPLGNLLAIDAPLPVMLTQDGEGQVTPASTTILKGESSATVQFQAKGPANVSLKASGGGKDSAPLSILVGNAAQALVLTPQSASALGLGFGRATITLQRVDASNAPIAEPTDLDISFDATGVAIPPMLARIPANHSSTSVEITSARAGFGTITPRSNLKGNSVQINFVWPWAIAVAALVGSVLGAYLRWIKLGENSARSFPKLALEASAVSIVVVAAVLLGIKYGPIPQAAAATEGGAFFLGIFAGVIGVVALDTIFAASEKKP